MFVYYKDESGIRWGEPRNKSVTTCTAVFLKFKALWNYYACTLPLPVPLHFPQVAYEYRSVLSRQQLPSPLHLTWVAVPLPVVPELRPVPSQRSGVLSLQLIARIPHPPATNSNSYPEERALCTTLSEISHSLEPTAVACDSVIKWHYSCILCVQTNNTVMPNTCISQVWISTMLLVILLQVLCHILHVNIRKVTWN